MNAIKEKPSLTTLNNMDRDAFIGALGHLFEHSPWVAERAWEKRPFHSVDALHEAFLTSVREADPETRLALIRAHPDLAGKAAIDGSLTAESAFEQHGAGLDQMTPEEYARFHNLNEAYKKAFGIPFIICVRENTKFSILEAFEKRLQSAPDAELDTAIGQIARITRLRLQDLQIEA
jgi:2-oxo-4-hydroxy-4-carboxy-5-ureidoimidazoline decarboxylase